MEVKCRCGRVQTEQPKRYLKEKMIAGTDENCLSLVENKQDLKPDLKPRRLC